MNKLREFAGKPVSILEGTRWLGSNGKMRVEYICEDWEIGIGEVDTVPAVGDLLTFNDERFKVIKPIIHFQGNMFPYVAVERIGHEFKGE